MQIDSDELRRLRERKGWLAIDLARAAGVSQSYESAIERGAHEPSPRVVARLAGALEVSIEALLPTRLSEVV